MIKKLSIIIMILVMVTILVACGDVTDLTSSKVESEITFATPITTDKLSEAIVTQEPVTMTPSTEQTNDISNTSTEITNNQEEETSTKTMSHYINLDFDAIYKSEGKKLSEKELSELQEYLNNKYFAGLLYSEFRNPEEISLYYTFYNMFDFSLSLTDEECKRFYPDEDVWWDAWYNTRKDIDTFLEKYTGLSLSYFENKQPGSAGQYEESIDGYLRGATDVCYVIPELDFGFKNEDEITVWYKDAL